jgi:histidinol-phosphatase (PHP family)
MNNNNTLLADFHIHSPYCRHAEGKIIEYVEVAVSRGMKKICITDHLGRYYLTESQKRRYWDWGMNQSHIERYYTEIDDLKNIYKDRIDIKTGLEVDFIEGAEDQIQPLIDPYPFDFILGSIHCLPKFGWKHIANYTDKDMWLIFEEYLRVAKNLVASGVFDSLAHIDFIWRYAKWPTKKSDLIFGYIEDIVKTASQKNVAIEINSNGYLWSQIYTITDGDPFEILLKNIKKYNAMITVGSDAHKPQFLAKSFKEIAHMLKNAGITSYCTFEGRKKIVEPVP